MKIIVVLTDLKIIGIQIQMLKVLMEYGRSM